MISELSPSSATTFQQVPPDRITGVRYSSSRGDGTTVPLPTSTSIGVLNSHTNSHKESVLHKLGGKEQLRKAVDRFYDQLVQEESDLRQFFERTNIQILKWHQFNFLSIAFSNPQDMLADNLDIRSMILTRHEELFDMGLNESHYDTMMAYFVTTLQRMEVAQEYINEALETLFPIRAVFQQGAVLARKRRDSRMTREAIVQMTTTVMFVGAIAFGIFRASSGGAARRGLHLPFYR